MNYNHTLSSGSSFTSGWTKIPDGFNVSLAWSTQFPTLISVQQSQHQDGLIPTTLLATITSADIGSAYVAPSQPYVRGVYTNLNLTSSNYVQVRTTNFAQPQPTTMLPAQAPTIADLIPYNSLVAESDFQLVNESFAYSTVSSTVKFNLGTGASVTFATGTMNLVAAASTLSTLVARSTMPVLSRPGKGSRARFSLGFPSTVSAHEAYAGFIGPNGMFALGLSNSNFGVVLDTIAVNPAYAASVTATGPGTASIVLDGNTYTATLSAAFTTTHAGAFYMANATLSNFGRGWRASQVGTAVTFMSEIPYVPSGAFTVSDVGGTTLSATFSVIAAGMTRSSLSFVPQSNFNIDRLNGTGPSGMSLTLANLNVFELAFHNSGNAYAAVQVPLTGRFVPFHAFYRLNSVSTTFQVPSMNLGYTMINRGNAVTPLTMSSTFMSGFVPQSTMVPTRGGATQRIWVRSSGADTTISSTFSTIQTIQLKPFIGTTPVQGFLQLITLNIHGTGAVTTDMVTCGVLKEATLTVQNGAASQTSIDPFGIVLGNTVSSTLSGRAAFLNRQYQSSPPAFWNLQALSLTCVPGETLAIAGSILGSSIATCSIATSWLEFF